MQRRRQSYTLLVILIMIGIAVYIVSEQPELLPKNNDHSWYYPEPDYAMSASDSELYSENIQLIQKEGWKLLMQDNVPVSFHSESSERNELIEDAALELLRGGYILNINEDGELESVELSKVARERFVSE